MTKRKSNNQYVYPNKHTGFQRTFYNLLLIITYLF